MKKSTFILIGMLLTVLVIAVTSCTYVPAGSKYIDKEVIEASSSQTLPIIIEELGAMKSNEGSNTSQVYLLKKDGVEYIVVIGYNRGTAIIKHEPVERKPVNMDSVVTNSKWIPEYTMLGYTQAQPTKQSLESYYNPEKRPIPIGS